MLHNSITIARQLRGHASESAAEGYVQEQFERPHAKGTPLRPPGAEPVPTIVRRQPRVTGPVRLASWLVEPGCPRGARCLSLFCHSYTPAPERREAPPVQHDRFVRFQQVGEDFSRSLVSRLSLVRSPRNGHSARGCRRQHAFKILERGSRTLVVGMRLDTNLERRRRHTSARSVNTAPGFGLRGLEDSSTNDRSSVSTLSRRRLTLPYRTSHGDFAPHHVEHPLLVDANPARFFSESMRASGRSGTAPRSGDPPGRAASRQRRAGRHRSRRPGRAGAAPKTVSRIVARRSIRRHAPQRPSARAHGWLGNGWSHASSGMIVRNER